MAMNLDSWKNRLRKTYFYTPYLRIRQRQEITRWQKAGSPVPPPHPWKRRILLEYRRQHNLAVFVETGTFHGDMIEAVRRNFAKVYSIELDRFLYAQAANRFARYPNVVLLHGNSGEVLPQLLSQLRAPTLFWLDGHYSGGVTARGEKDTPIVDELKAVLQDRDSNHVVLIDDARCFDGTNDYPTISELHEIVMSLRSTTKFTVADDIIRILC